MPERKKEIVLSPNEYILARSEKTWYRLKKGCIQVYLLPIVNGSYGKEKLLCQIRDTDRNRGVPSLACPQETQRKWDILIKPAEGEAEISCMPGMTEVLLEQFLRRAGITTYGELGFEGSLAAFYGQLESLPGQKNNSRKQIRLNSAERYLSADPWEAYCLEQGAIFVYIVPMNGEHPGQPEYYCEVRASDANKMIPALHYTDSAYRNWRLQIKSAEEDAVLTVLPRGATEALRREFLERRGIGTYEQEGFENSLLEFYTKQVKVKGAGFIRKSDKAGSESQERIAEVIRETFEESGQTAHTGNDYYQALQFVCRRMDISLLPARELHIRCGKNPDIQEIARASHFICRKIVLDADWYRYDCGGFVGTLDKEIIACVPDKKGRYQLFRSSDERVVPVTPELAGQISPQAYSLGRTLPLKSLTRRDVFRFCAGSICARDLMPYIGLVLLCALIGILLPTLNSMIYDDYIPVGNVGSLTQLCLIMLTFMTGNVAFSIVKNLFAYRITSRVGNDLQNAVYHRLFHLPESFFRGYDSADLAGRISGIGAVANRYANTLVISSISSFFALFYLIRMFTYNGKLTWISLGVYGVYLLVIVAITSTARKGQLRAAEAESESSGRLYQYLNGVDKIRMAGVEERALLSYMEPYARVQYEQIRINRLVSLEEALSSVVESLFSMVLYWYIVNKLDGDALSIGSFVAFNSAFGAFTGALGSLVEEGLQIFQERKEIDRFWPVFSTVPEDDDSKEVPGELEGGLKVEDVIFSYEEGKKVLNNLSLEIKPNEYVGIVGPSGCGKSTLLKLLLGFETPREGKVTVDGKNLRSIHKGAYRQQLGVVLQNGQLISGSIYENITITAPNATLARVNQVVEQVGLKEDIRQMPMGLHTMLSENCATISGGQKQRILIARAICGNPRILIFDEATSALDNMTQAAVSSSLDKMQVTRIVVAHRLSTIKNCSRILVMDAGKVIQEGTYEELMQDRQGLFYALASRQIAQ